MPDEVGPHLLGRRPNTPDDRDFTLDKILKLDAPPDSLADMTLRQVYDQTDYLKTWWGFLVLWRWVKTFFSAHPTPAPAPTPEPGPKSGFSEWGTLARLDQGDTGHCTGFAWANWGNSTPVSDVFANADGDAIYYEAKVIDGEPGQENGSSTRSAVKAMQSRGRTAAYAFGQSIDELNQWLDQKGPAVAGTDWWTGMFKPDQNGYVDVVGKVEGGHEWVILDRDPNLRVYECLNSWGDWGKNGLFYVREEDMQKLLFGGNGDVCFALELPR
jgi:hypothetical protein